MLHDLGFNPVWICQRVGDIYICLATFKHRLDDKYLQDWNRRRLKDSTRVRTYIETPTLCLILVYFIYILANKTLFEFLYSLA